MRPTHLQVVQAGSNKMVHLPDEHHADPTSIPRPPKAPVCINGVQQSVNAADHIRLISADGEEGGE